jgi:hypothetical protein
VNLNRVCISLFMAVPLSLATAAGKAATPGEDVGCTKLMQKVPRNLPQARKLGVLRGEIVAPDSDYCHEDFSKCELRTLMFDGFSLRLLHKKDSGQVSFHVAEFNSRREAERLCGKGCASSAMHDKRTKKYVVDCQAGI